MTISPSSRETRRSETNRRIREAVLEIIRSQGLGAVTMESVAALSGVAKTTLYRRYGDRHDLINGVLAELGPLPDDGGLAVNRESLVQILRQVQAGYQRHIGRASIGSMLSPDHETVTRWRAKLFLPHMEQLLAYLQRGVRDQILSPNLDYVLVVDMIMGGLLVGDAMRAELSLTWAENTVNTIWPLLAPQASGAAPPA